MSKISLYAEFLGNIGQISLHASLQTYKSEETKVFITSDQRTITVTHDGETANLFLPVKVSGTAEVTIPAQRAKDISVRLQVEEGVPDGLRVTELDDETYWPAGSLRTETQVKCRNCKNIVTHAEEKMTWKDLPSENWAELMDYWHCHKPHDEDDTEDVTNGAARKGYGASSKIVAEPNVGLIDVSSFLLAAVDCPGAQCKPDKLHNGYHKVQCRSCEALLGFQDDYAQGWRLYKWSLAVRALETSQWETHSVESILCTQLLTLIEAQAVRKFVVHSGGAPDDKPGLLLWVFNPDIWYSSSNVGDGTPRRAMKVFYRTIEKPQTLLEENNTSLEELYLPATTLENFRAALVDKTMMLPPSARNFQDWEVSLLDRPPKAS